MIVTTFNGSSGLCSAVKREVEKWRSFGLDYFSPGCKSEMETMETEMQHLQSKRCVCVWGGGGKPVSPGLLTILLLQIFFLVYRDMGSLPPCC